MPCRITKWRIKVLLFRREGTICKQNDGGVYYRNQHRKGALVKRLIPFICLLTVIFAAAPLFHPVSGVHPDYASLIRMFEAECHGLLTGADVAVSDLYFLSGGGALRALNLKRTPQNAGFPPLFAILSIAETVECSAESSAGEFRCMLFPELILTSVFPARAGPLFL